ncbi:putative Chemotaxis protein CheY [Magnetospirillum sp. LM-5]|uniref:response regulator n=1 Tax=Magnetospirillum sp. LM-5 TaxID=2681466 RepID=UPI0013818B7A|nr:response regulator [Magnetospirillum sp. LM-5]CAA7622460.1 putative Chemotaxis protein CheY [Magnetospirillum sp. LM-5]
MNSPLPILVVDDSAITRRLLADMLSNLGPYEVAEAKDGQEALDFMRSRPTGMVISDLHMGPIDGVQLLNTVRAEADLAHLPFVLMSGDQTPQAISSAIRAGVTAILAKPFDRHQLAQQVRHALCA